MVRNQKIHLDANPAVACIRRDRPSSRDHPRGVTEPITDAAEPIVLDPLA